MSRSSVLLLAVLAVATAAPAGAQQPEITAAGRALAIRHCAECHAVDTERTSPMKEAPRFPELYKVYPVERLDRAMERDEFTGMPHMKAFDLDSDERAQLQAYLTQFRPASVRQEREGRSPSPAR